ncbi:unnamed protein product [Amoebophrya sp. A25]|nr:unnamed protein product [Amoebophrya sp. A25]|eukprot:GSA25T00010190001.1
MPPRETTILYRRRGQDEVETVDDDPKASPIKQGAKSTGTGSSCVLSSTYATQVLVPMQL